MRLVRFDGGTTGLLVEVRGESMVVDIHASLAALREIEPAGSRLDDLFPGGATSWLPLITHWSEAAGPLRTLEAAAREPDRPGLALRRSKELVLEPPLPDPTVRTFAMGGNFASHVSGVVEDGTPAISVKVPDVASPPWGFFVIPGTVIGTGTAVVPPPGAQKLDYEAEVAVVLADDPTSIAAGGLPVWGYTAWNDFSIRDAALGLATLDHGPLTWSLQKNFATGNACGPCLVVDEPCDVHALRIECRVNGAVRQSGSTGQMIHRFDAIADYLGNYLPLRPGDMIVSGTPAGTAMESGVDGPFLQPGDVTEVEVDGVGVLRNRISAQPTPR